MSDDGEVTLSQAFLEDAPTRRRAKGLWVLGGLDLLVCPQTQSWVSAARALGRGREQISPEWSGCVSPLKLHRDGRRPLPDKWRAGPRPEPDPGKPAVRDRRGAS